MPEIIDALKDPYGLNGGTILSGSVSMSCDSFWYLPITNTVATVIISNLLNTELLTDIPFTAGNGIYGNITEVTQSSGFAVVYSGSYFYPNLRN